MTVTAAPERPTAPAPVGKSEGGVDEKTAITHFSSLKKRVYVQTWIIIVLSVILVLIAPIAQPVYMYYARKPDDTIARLIALTMPNMTNRAITSWATTSVTEIMTMGFGDMDVKLPKQKWRFTNDGWEAYVNAFVRQKIGETFKKSQLVLTTAPSNTPVIVWQGVNQDQVYEWVVQMPVIMTYATNNNVTDKKSAIVTLTIIRVPAENDAAGIAIDGWRIGK